MEETKFIRVGENISFAPKGLDYTLEAGKVYSIYYDHNNDETKMRITNGFSMPSTIYTTEEDDKFIDRVLSCYNRKSTTTGVMLAGLKGAGKTVLAKRIALQSDKPIVLLDTSFPPRALPEVADRLSGQDVCMIIDELDKFDDRYNGSSWMLQMFDGICANGHNLIITTCNEMDKVDQYLKDRCSRIRYYRYFDNLSENTIKQACEQFKWSKGVSKDTIDDMVKFIAEKFKVVSFDNVLSFIDEYDNHRDESFDDIVDCMNIFTR